MSYFAETVKPSLPPPHHPSARHKAASKISSCPRRQWVKLIQALAALIKPHEGKKRQASASHTQATGIVPAPLLIERWVANEAGHTALSLETQQHRSTPTSHPLSPEDKRDNEETWRILPGLGFEFGSLPNGCSYTGCFVGCLKASGDSITPLVDLFDHLSLTVSSVFYFSYTSEESNLISSDFKIGLLIFWTDIAHLQ